MTFNPSPEQLAIAAGFRADKRNKAIDAAAGSGKSTTLFYLAETEINPAHSTLMCVFNRRPAQELSAKIQEKPGLRKVKAKTFNSLGYGVFCQRYGIKNTDVELNVDVHKYSNLARWWINSFLKRDEHEKEDLKDAREYLEGLIQMFMVNTTIHHETGEVVMFNGGLLNEEYSTIPHALESGADSIRMRYDLGTLRFPADEIRLVDEAFPMLMDIGFLAFHDPGECLSKWGEIVEESFIEAHLKEGKRWLDFNDQLYYMVVNNWRVNWQSMNVLVDEAQDLSPLFRAVVDKQILKSRGGRLVMVGDPAQAINAFAGADNEGFANSLIFWGVEQAYPLNTCYRCPVKIVEMNQGWKAGFTPAPNAIPGETGTITKMDMLKMLKETPMETALISRIRSAAVSNWRLLTREGIPAKLLGINPAEVILSVLETVADREGFQFTNLYQHVMDFRDERIQKMRDRNKSEGAISSYMDRMQMVLDAVKLIEAPSMLALIDRIQEEYNPDNQPKDAQVVIMTGHVSKGGEWDRVIILTPDLFPFSYENQSDDEYIQEKNLEYVVNTRSKKCHFFLDTTGKAPSYFAKLPEPAANPDETVIENPVIIVSKIEPAQLPASTTPEPEAPLRVTGNLNEDLRRFGTGQTVAPKRTGPALEQQVMTMLQELQDDELATIQRLIQLVRDQRAEVKNGDS